MRTSTSSLVSLALLTCLAACPDRATDGIDDTATMTDASSGPAPTTSGTTAVVTSDPTTADPTSSDPTTADPTTGSPACTPYTYHEDLPLLSPHVMLVIDQSPAMLDPWDHDADPQTPEIPRWASVRAVLEAVLPVSAADHVALGLARYPGAAATDMYGAQACTSDPSEFVAPSLDASEAILAALPAGDAALVGAAPLRPALAGAIDLLPDVDDWNPRYVVWITHSAPNCAEAALDPMALLETLDGAVPALVKAAADAGIATYTVAVGAADGDSPALMDMRPDGVDLPAYLLDLPLGNYANPHTEPALKSDLSRLLTDQTDKSCSIMIHPPPGLDQHVAEVRLGRQPIAGPLRDCQSEDGWEWTAPDSVLLCGASCALFHEIGTVDIDVACAP